MTGRTHRAPRASPQGTGRVERAGRLFKVGELVGDVAQHGLGEAGADLAEVDQLADVVVRAHEQGAEGARGRRVPVPSRPQRRRFGAERGV
jgi:hypothetical protein